MIEEKEAAEEDREAAAEAEMLMKQEQERDRVRNERIRDTENTEAWLRDLDQQREDAGRELEDLYNDYEDAKTQEDFINLDAAINGIYDW